MDYSIIRKQERRYRNGIRRELIITSTAVAAIIVTAVSVGIHLHNKSRLAAEEALYSAQQPDFTPIPTSTPLPTNEPRRGYAQSVPKEIQALMNGGSMRSGSSTTFKDLMYLKIPHFDFNSNVAEGELIVHKSIANEVLDIFSELFVIGYPIERMELIDKYNADEFASKDANNTTAFYTANSDTPKSHSLGMAIDINPQINPHVENNGTSKHANTAEYLSRNNDLWSSEIARCAYIGPDTEVFNIFVNKYGWEWGGTWQNNRRYHHFEKPQQ